MCGNTHTEGTSVLMATAVGAIMAPLLAGGEAQRSAESLALQAEPVQFLSGLMASSLRNPVEAKLSSPSIVCSRAVCIGDQFISEESQDSARAMTHKEMHAI
jgi:hypothetical protein